MKKYILLLAFIFVFSSFGLSAKAAVSATASGCVYGSSFSATTGQPCVTPTPVIPTQNSSVSVSALSPNSGAVGTSVVITGSGFTSNNSVSFGGGYLNSLSSSNGTTITFTVPNALGYCPPVFNGMMVACPELSRLVTAGNYNVSVVNANGISNTVSFTVTGSGIVPPPTPIPTPTSPVISGISGPQTLSVNTQGTWSVTATYGNNGNLSYSVNWGDTPIAYPMSTSATTPMTQQSATFTHSYATAGIYNPTFTVTNVNGLTARASLSVNVGGVTNPIHPCPVVDSNNSTSGVGTDCVKINPIPPKTCFFNNVLRVGSKGDDVKCLQAYLGIDADGFFGNQTKISIEAWQKNHGLNADGVFGPKSRTASNLGSTTTQ